MDGAAGFSESERFLAQIQRLSKVVGNRSKFFRGQIDKEWLGQNYSWQAAEHANRIMDSREKIGHDRIFDVHYADLMREPIATMRKVYHALGDELGEVRLCAIYLFGLFCCFYEFLDDLHRLLLHTLLHKLDLHWRDACLCQSPLCPHAPITLNLLPIQYRIFCSLTYAITTQQTDVSIRYQQDTCRAIRRRRHRMCVFAIGIKNMRR